MFFSTHKGSNIPMISPHFISFRYPYAKDTISPDFSPHLISFNIPMIFHIL